MTVQRPLLVVVDDEQGILDVVGRFAGVQGSTCSPVRADAKPSNCCRCGAPISSWSTCGCPMSAGSTCCGRFAKPIRAARQC